MSPLPPSPNLGHLKGQAKHLLKAYHLGDAKASSRVYAQLKRFEASRFLLADAQLVIAREYGFSNWAKLKLHVEKGTAKRPEPSARKAFVRDLAQQLLAWSRHHESEKLGHHFAMMPLRDILAVRDVVVKNGEHSLVVDGLLEGLKHVKPRVRYTCAGELDHLADERCAEPLRQLLNDPVPRVRRAALHSLSCDACKVSPLPGHADLVPTLIDLALNDSSIRVRRTAVVSLAECDARVIPVFQKLLEEKDNVIQRTIRRALERQQVMTSS